MSSQHSSSATEHFNKVIQFRQAVYDRMGTGRDAMFALTDAVIQMRQVQSFAELSCAPAFGRKWPSVYAAMQDGRIKRAELQRLYLEQAAEQPRLILAGDHSAWPHVWSRTMEGCSYQHQSNPLPGQRPVTVGHGYSTLAIIPEGAGSWALPCSQERIRNQKPAETVAEQMREVCPNLPPGRHLLLVDSEYGSATFVRASADIPMDKLVRLRTNLALEGPACLPGKRKALLKHGKKFKFKDPSTWWAPDQMVEETDAKYGPQTVRLWKELRFKAAVDCPLTVALLERAQASDSRRQPKQIWLAWIGNEPPEQWWQLYRRRYPIDHWYRFAKGRLHWTLPHFSTPQQCDLWSDLMAFLTWELWLARPVVADMPLPWQKPQKTLTPGRVCQGFQNLLVAIGTPIKACKSRGRSPGWTQGRPRTPRKRFEWVRSEVWKTKRKRKKAREAGHPAKKGRPKKNDRFGAV